MAFPDKNLINTADNIPGPQYYNATTDSFEPAQGVSNALNNIGSRVIYSGNGTATQTISGFGTGVSFLLKNDGATDLTITINAMTFTIKQSEVFDEYFNPFTSVSITGTSAYRFWIRGF